MDALTPPANALRVFLCHSSDDKPAVRELYEQLVKEGFDPWLDEEKLLPGQNWKREISKAVREADAVLVCLSQSSISKRGYIQKEIKVALEVACEFPEGTIFLIPVKLEKCEVPEQLSELHWVNLFETDGFGRLVKTLDYRASELGIKKRLHSSKQQGGINFRSKLSSTVRAFTSLLSSDLAIDCGGGSTLIFAKGSGIVVSEPSVVAVNKITNLVEAFGREATELSRAHPDNIIRFRPIYDGLIRNQEIAEQMLYYFITKAHNGKTWVSPRILLPVCSGLDEAERQAFIDVGYRAGAAEVYVADRGLCAALGAGLPVTEPRGTLIVDIGAGITETTVISSTQIVYSRIIRVAGTVMDESLKYYIKRKYNMLLSDVVAQALKIELGSAFPLDKPLSLDVVGRNLSDNTVKIITVTDEEVREALADSVMTIVNAVRVALERTPPELCADIIERGIILTGGGVLLKNLDKRLLIETGLPVSIAPDPVSSVVLGASKMLSDLSYMKTKKIVSACTPTKA